MNRCINYLPDNENSKNFKDIDSSYKEFLQKQKNITEYKKNLEKKQREKDE